jgi:hypothetical protein
MSATNIQYLDDAKAFSATLNFEALERFHVPFDELTDTNATESRLAPLVRQGRRVAIWAPSGEGKSSVITSVLGPLALNEPIFTIQIPVAGATDGTITDSESFFRYLLSVLARWSDRTELERQDRKRLDRMEGELRDRQETRHAGITFPLWFLQPELAREVTTTIRAIDNYADALETLRQAVALLRSAGREPVIVFDDTDAWLQSVELDRRRLASGFFAGPFLRLAKDVEVGIVLAVHPSYGAIPEYNVARELLDATIEVPRFDGTATPALDRILSHRVVQVLGTDTPLADVAENQAIAQIADFYGAGAGHTLRSTIRVANTALEHARRNDASQITTPMVLQAIAEETG